MESTRLIFADSRNRDSKLYPTGNSYTLHLTTPIKNVSRVDLVSLRVPNTMYNITNGSNVLTVGTSNISMYPGFYSAGCLSSTLVPLVNNAFSMSYITNEGKFLLSNASQFSFKINSSELSNLMGITQGTTFKSSLAGPLEPCYAGDNIFKSNTMINMNTNEYIFLDIDELKTPSHIDTKSISGTTGTISGSNINRAFAPVMLDVQSGSFKIHEENSNYIVSVHYPEPIRSLQRLTVRWYDTNGNVLNFRGFDNHAFILRAHVLDEKPNQPPPPVEEIELKRLVEAISVMPPPPSEKKKIPWVIMFLTFIGLFVAWKFWSTHGSLHTGAGRAPGSSH